MMIDSTEDLIHEYALSKESAVSLIDKITSIDSVKLFDEFRKNIGSSFSKIEFNLKKFVMEYGH